MSLILLLTGIVIDTHHISRLALAGVLAIGAAFAAPGRWIGGAPSVRDGSPPGRAGAGAFVERTTYAMGTILDVRVDAEDRKAAIRASEAVLHAVERWDDLLSTWRPATPLTDLNSAPAGREVALDPELFRLLVEVRSWSRRTGGAFDPAVGALVELWDVRGSGRHPRPAELERALASTGFRCFALDGAAGRARRGCRGARLDAGAFGKGAALRTARRALDAAGARSAWIDFGGQELAFGAPPRSSGWPVGVAHPSRRDEVAVQLRLAGGSVATTGQSERGVETAGGRIGHVLDPRTGLPVPPWGSVTVVADDPLVADILSTALFVMGPREGMEWLEGRPEVAALFLVEERDGGLTVRATGVMRRLLADAPATGG